MDWRTEVDQRLLMPLHELLWKLSCEAVSDFPEDVLNGATRPFSDRVQRHSELLLDFLEKGCLLGEVQIFRGTTETLSDMRDCNRGIDGLCRHIANIKNLLAARVRTETEGIKVLIEHLALPITGDGTLGDREIAARSELAQLLEIKKVLSGAFNEIEVRPGMVIRWLNRYPEGQKLLPCSLKDYLSEHGEYDDEARLDDGTASLSASEELFIDSIVVKNRLSSAAQGTGRDQLRNTINENPDAFRRVEGLRATMGIPEIEKKLAGGRHVKACLLFPDSASPEAAYKQLLRAEGKEEQ